MAFILSLICTYFMITYAMSRRRSMWGRIFSLSMIVVMWLVPFGWIPGLIWGALCWGDARAGGH